MRSFGNWTLRDTQLTICLWPSVQPVSPWNIVAHTSASSSTDPHTQKVASPLDLCWTWEPISSAEGQAPRPVLKPGHLRFLVHSCSQTREERCYEESSLTGPWYPSPSYWFLVLVPRDNLFLPLGFSLVYPESFLPEKASLCLFKKHTAVNLEKNILDICLWFYAAWVWGIELTSSILFKIAFHSWSTLE